MWEREAVGGGRIGGAGAEVGVVPLGAGFLCACRDLSAAIYFTSPQQTRQEISTQPED